MNLGMHEAAELHELLTFKTVCTAKNQVNQGVVQCQQLKALINEDLTKSATCIQELKSFVNPGGMQ